MAFEEPGKTAESPDVRVGADVPDVVPHIADTAGTPRSQSDTVSGVGSGTSVDANIVAYIASAPLPDIVRGKTLSQWGIERRSAAKFLKQQLQERLVPIAGTPALAVRASGFLSEIESLMQRYTALPNEEIFAGMLQLIRDAISGHNFESFENGDVSAPIVETLDLAMTKKLTLAEHDKAIAAFLKVGPLPGPSWQDAEDTR